MVSPANVNDDGAAVEKAAGKLVHLEAGRGIASIMVVFHHFCLAFLPAAKLAPITKGGLRFTPLFSLANGSGAVCFFFILSGFVLTQGFFRRPEPAALLRSVIKRLPRLMIPASITIFLGATILTFDSGHYKEAGQITGSTWLQSFGNAGFPTDFAGPSISSAAQQCLAVFLLGENAYYNTNLWTMVYEFYGSMLVFGVAGLVVFGAVKHCAMIALHVVLIAVLALWREYAFVAFLLGSGLAYISVAIGVKLEISNRATAVLLALSVILLSNDFWPTDVVASFLCMLALTGNQTIARRLSGRAGSLLGQSSFPLYLVHTLVILSISSAAFMRVNVDMKWPWTIALTLMLTVACAALLSVPFIFLERIWVPALNLWMKKIIPGARAAPETSDAAR